MNPFKEYEKYVGSKPIVESALLGAGGALAGRTGADVLGRMMLGLSVVGEDDPAKEEAWLRFKNSDRYKSLKNLSTGAGLALGALYPMYKSYNGNMALGDNIKKYFNKSGFYKNNPGQLQKDVVYAKDNPPGSDLPYIPNPHAYNSGRTINMDKIGSSQGDKVVRIWADYFKQMDDASGLTAVLQSAQKEASTAEVPSDTMREQISKMFYAGMDKEAFFNPYSNTNEQLQYPFISPIIPVHQGIQMIERDPFLTENNKQQVQYIMSHTGEGDSGSVSGFDLADSAIKAGVGLAAGIAFGKTMGNLFALDSAKTDRHLVNGAVGSHD